VLDNLLSNAVKYSPRGSIIAVDLVAEAGGIAVTVIDEGPGLTPDDLCQAFGEFARLSAQPTGGESSHGLGLAIVKRIVELHGGRAWAENRDDRSGARFGFWVPVGGPAGTDCRCR
jgi:signal transduction histidine kinase